jgi:pantothenate kinase
VRRAKPRVVRLRFIRRVRQEHFRQALEVAMEMSALQRDRGWPEETHWVGLGGPADTLITEMEFSSLRSLEDWQGQSDADAEYSSLRQQAAAHIVEGSARVEILQTAHQLARDATVPLVVQLRGKEVEMTRSGARTKARNASPRR